MSSIDIRQTCEVSFCIVMSKWTQNEPLAMALRFRYPREVFDVGAEKRKVEDSSQELLLAARRGQVC